MGAAFIKRRPQRRHQRDKAADRIVGTFRISDVALPAANNQSAVERTATAGFDSVADDFDIAWLAENAMIESFAALGRPFEQLDRAIDRYTFLIAGNQERDRASRLAAICGQIVERSRGKAGDPAFHVDGATTVQAIADDHPGKG